MTKDYVIFNRKSGRYLGGTNVIKITSSVGKHTFHGPDDNATRFTLDEAHSFIYKHQGFSFHPVDPMKCKWD